MYLPFGGLFTLRRRAGLSLPLSPMLFPLDRILIGPILIGMLCSGPIAIADEVVSESDLAAKFTQQIRPTLVKFCGACHDPEDDEDPVRFLRSLQALDVAKHRGVWASSAEQLRNRTMPPSDEAQPSEQQRLEIAQWIETYLDETACSQGDFAGSPVPRRLNRDQYTFAIEDLTGEKFDFVETFPADGGGGEGFDNNGETLFLPPLLIERYMEVAQQVLDHVIVTEPFDVTYGVEQTESPQRFEFVDKESSESVAKLELPTGSIASVLLPVYTDSDFGFALKAIHSAQEPSPIVLSIDGIEVQRLLIPVPKKAEPRWTKLHFSRGAHRIDLRVPEDASPITIEWLRLNQETGDKKQRRKRQAATDRLFAPAKSMIGEDNDQAAATIIRTFAGQAWRRGLTDDETDSLMQLYDRGARRGETFQQAIKLPLKAVLVSPKFLFVAEQGHDSPGIHRISDVELASRLSLFLWHSLPDEELIRLAEKDELHRADVLEKQVRRMLSDDRSSRFAEAFAGQWLGTVAVGRTVIPDTDHFKKAYTTDLVTDLRRQVGETMQLMIKNNRPVTDWLDCDYVVVNKRLAKHYGIEPVPVSDLNFEEISVKNSPRPGVLGLGAVHMLTSYSKRTSPVLRGGWVLETIFGTRLPAPPPDAGNLSGGEKEVKEKTVRQRLEKHRENPSCAACHDLIDPIGFALENFDVLGRWRDKEGENQIDSFGRLPSGETFTGPSELRAVLVGRKDEFVRHFSRQMLGFALGRSLEDADSCTVSAITTRLRENEYKLEELVIGIVESIPFQYRQGSVASPESNSDSVPE